ncbi:MAG: zinc-dependent alcohol dehydrogenase family protein [bacterium]|nr:zinc-dependent alcohol dehydrogenase family protein [candidate division KSB1 bacterium]MDH7561316.1 zinc-dependent alcohol dehydrogenase family protein [bacterium]
MRAMLLRELGPVGEGRLPLELAELSEPEAKTGEVLIKVAACGVCHTELDEIEGRTPPPQLPVVLGHQVVGRIVARGKGVTARRVGERVGVAWIFSACGKCEYCQSGQENLCSHFRATGRDANGGYAEYMVAPEQFVYPIPERFSDTQAAPLLCAGAIGYRSLALTGMRDGQRLGLTGFGASGHLVLKMAKHRFPHSEVYVFARSEGERDFARQLGATWAGDTDDLPPALLHCIIDTTPVWRPVVAALERLAPGGRLVINAIRKEEVDKQALLALDYPRHLWLAKEIKSVANVTRQDVREFLALAAEIPIVPEVEVYPLEEANTALRELKERKIRGAKVLVIK